jgi:leucyl aminopeptidase
MKNGVTVHVKNTDAEGRLVLFDNICLAQEQNRDADEMYTFATLTGAAISQFGNEAAGMIGHNDKMKHRIAKAGNKAGEIFMDAAFNKYMLNGVDDTLADLSNTGTANMVRVV